MILNNMSMWTPKINSQIIVSNDLKQIACLTLNFPSNLFLSLMDDYFPTLTPPYSFIHNQITLNIKPTWISIHKLMSHAIRRWLECVKTCQSGKWSYFCCVRSSCKGVDSNHCMPLWCKLCMNIKDAYFGKSDCFDACVKMALVLTSTA